MTGPATQPRGGTHAVSLVASAAAIVIAIRAGFVFGDTRLFHWRARRWASSPSSPRSGRNPPGSGSSPS